MTIMMYNKCDILEIWHWQRQFLTLKQDRSTCFITDDIYLVQFGILLELLQITVEINL